MSTLSSSLNALASSTFVDILPDTYTSKLSPEKQLRLSRMISMVWGIVTIGGASIFTDMTNPLVEIGLAIASFTYGSMLALFLLMRFFPKGQQWTYIVTFFVTLISMILIIKAHIFHYTWYIAIGILISYVVWGQLYYHSRKKN